MPCQLNVSADLKTGLKNNLDQHKLLCAQKSALGPLFLEGQREAFADMLNQTILYAEMVTEQGSPAAPQVPISSDRQGRQ